MAKFYEVPFEGEEPSIYFVTGYTVALLWEGKLVSSYMSVGGLLEGVESGSVIAHY